MALQLETELDSGLIVNYYRVESVITTPEYSQILVSIYKDKNARDSGKTPVKSIGVNVCSISVDCTNPIEFAYLKMKQLADYSAATDV